MLVSHVLLFSDGQQFVLLCTITFIYIYIYIYTNSFTCVQCQSQTFSLVRNWGNEVQKWAGVSLYGRTIVAGKSGQAGAQAAADFNIGSHKRFSLLITSYDLYRSHSKWINKTKGLGLLVCDEAHRLKVGKIVSFFLCNW